MKRAVTVFSTVAALLAASLTFAAAKPDGAAILKERCGTCHSADRVKGMKKSKAEWDKIVSRMISKGAKLSAEEKGALVDHLAKTYK
jgi:cytochrome c5